MTAVRWVTARRGSAWGELETAFAGRGRLGAVLVGPAGVGKTVMARAAAKSLASKNPRIVSHWVSGTATASVVPFGAFSHLVEVAGVGEPATLLRAARASLSQESEHGLLLAVDDAHHLDTLSATMVHQLAVSGAARMLLTVRSGDPAPDAVTALWKDELLTRIDIVPFTRGETATLLETVLDGPVETVTVDRIFKISEGNPLYLRHLVDGAVGGGALRQVEGVWQLRGEMALNPQLSTLITQHLTAMKPAVKTVLEYLAVEEPLRLSDLCALTSRDAVEQAEGAGTILVRERADDAVVHPVHPLYTECMRASLGQLAAQRLRTSLVSQLTKRPTAHVSERLRLAALSLGSESPPPAAELITSSWEAMRLGDLALGERLARGALRQSPELAARLPLAHSLAWQGRGRDADEVLNAVDPDSLSEWDLMAWTLPHAANKFWMLSQSEAGVAFLADMRSRISTPAALRTIDALAATFAMNQGDLRQGAHVARSVLESDDAVDLAVAWAAATATLSAARLGRFDEVDALAERGLSAEHPGLLRFTIGLGQTTKMIMLGQLDEAEQLARHYLTFAEFQQPGRAIGEVLLGHTLLARGSYREATGLLRQAAAALTSTGYSWGPLAMMLLAQALGAQGDAATATRALRRAESGHGMSSALYAPELALGRAWTLAAGRDIRGAIAATHDAAHAAEQTRQSTVALRALHEGVRLGDTSGVDRIARLCSEIDCVTAQLALAHARALAGRDPAALDKVSVDLEAIGMIGAAADAAAQAATLYEAANKRKGELAAKSRAGELASACGGPSTPALERVLSPLPLSGREREVAVMVSEGMTNKAIADKLCVSVRTVEGHVYKACMKLGVPDRTMLASAVAAATAGERKVAGG